MTNNPSWSRIARASTESCVPGNLSVLSEPGQLVPLLHRLFEILSGSDTSKHQMLLKACCLWPFMSADWVTQRQGSGYIEKNLHGFLPLGLWLTQGCCSAPFLTSQGKRSAENGTLRQETFLGFPVGKKFKNNELVRRICSKCWGCQHSCKWANGLLSYIYNWRASWPPPQRRLLSQFRLYSRLAWQ